MSKSVLIRGARQLLTLVGRPGPRRGAAMRSLGLIQDGAVLIVDGEIRDIGPSRRVEHLAGARDAFEIDASGKVVMPGFVDCHARLIAGPPCLDNYENGTPSGPAELFNNVRLVRTFSKHRMRIEARKQIRQFVRHGTTTVDARSGLGLDESTELKLLRVLEDLEENPLAVSPSFAGALACPPEFGGRATEYISWLVDRMLPEVQRRRLARFVDVSCGTATGFTASEAARVLDAARGLGFAVRVNTGACAAANHAVRLAVESGAVSIDGLVEADPDEIRFLAGSGTIATLLPGRAFQSRTECSSVARALIDGGAAVALATAFDPLDSPSCSMPMMLSLACAGMKMTPAEAVTAATINAACALRTDYRSGSLESGKDGDLVLLGTGDYREAAFRFGINPVEMVIRRGEIIYPRVEAI